MGVKGRTPVRLTFWRLLLIGGVLWGVTYIVSRFWHPSLVEALPLLILCVLGPIWGQLDRIERKLDAISKGK